MDKIEKKKLISVEFEWSEPKVPSTLSFSHEKGWKQFLILVRERPIGKFKWQDGTTSVQQIPEKDFWDAEIDRLRKMYPEIDGRTMIIR